MPIDAEPVDNGNITLTRDGCCIVHGGTMFDNPPAGRRYVSHFATCPNARSHRKKKS